MNLQGCGVAPPTGMTVLMQRRQVLTSSSTCAAGPSVATPFTGCGMATPAPALLPALVVRSGAQGTGKPQGLPNGGWRPRNSIVRDALQVGHWPPTQKTGLGHCIFSVRYCREGCNGEVEMGLTAGVSCCRT